MNPQKREHPVEKTSLHPRNKHRERYDFEILVNCSPELAKFVFINKFDDKSIDFANPLAVKALNKALLKQYYNIENWDIPENYLCPPIPGRADYIHYVADLLGSKNINVIPKGQNIKCLDIGVGANCIYPIIGNTEYGWTFVGSDIDPVAIHAAGKIIELNPTLENSIELRLQKIRKCFFDGIIQKGELFDLTVCNPPFHASAAEANAATFRKVSNLGNIAKTKPIQNFGGQSSELWCEGGEVSFIIGMINESKKFHASCFWFTTLVSREENLKKVFVALRKAEATEMKIIPMGQGNKVSRMVAWTFLSPENQKSWITSRWR
jgi:23S rRNA (adenine1618-N6)-methyltransferase